MRIHWIAAGLCLAVSAVLKFALVGYGTLAAAFLCAALVVLFFGALRVMRRRGKAPRAVKALRIAMWCCLAAGCVLFGVLEGLVISGAGTDAEEADYLIVLGAGVNGTTPSLSLVNRLEAARDYLQAHPDCVAVLSGGQGPGEDIPEAEAMFRWLTAEGIPAERLIPENRATTTRENIGFSMELIAAREDPAQVSVAIVSSEYHLYRAKAMARSLGYEAKGVAAETSLPVLKINYFMREAFALLHFTVFGW